MKKTNIVHNTLAKSVKLVEAQKLHELIKSKDCDQETLKTAIQNFGKMYINATYLVPDTINEYFARGLDKHATLLTTAVKSENLPLLNSLLNLTQTFLIDHYLCIVTSRTIQ